MLNAGLLFLSFITTYVGVELIRRWSLKRNLLDVPNSRSSHSVPTPRGGGAAIVIVCILGYCILGLAFGTKLYISFVFGSIIIALVSWVDDLISVSFIYRLAVHSIAAFAVIFEIGYFSNLKIPGVFDPFDLGVIGAVITFFWIVWSVNAYNFMDGIDGIAGLQGIISSLSYLILLYFWGVSEQFIFLYGILGSISGFLILNWPPAKIFMGDTGSSFLGFLFSVFPLLILNGIEEAKRPYMALIGLSFLWLFIFDTIFTFCRRLIKRESFWKAHRSHLYQRMIIKGYSHRSVTIIYGTIAIMISLFMIFSINFGYMFLSLFVLTISSLIILLLSAGKELTFQK